MNIVIYVDTMERFRFFSRLSTAFGALGHTVSMVTPRLSVYLRGKLAGQTMLLLKSGKPAEVLPDSVWKSSLSILNRYHSEAEARAIASAMVRLLELLHAQRPVELLCLWNGTTTLARAAAYFARRRGIAIRFFELSNLGKRIFVDTEGTSGASCVAAHPEMLDGHPAEEAAYRAWRDARRRETALPKQAANRARVPWHAFVDFVGYGLGCVREDRRPILRLLATRLLNRFRAHRFPEAPLGRPFVFLPLQVSDDSQLKLFSRYSNRELLYEALRLAKTRGLRLIVKLHPAESDRGEIERMIDLARREGFVLAGNPTRELIEGAELVVVNNSTVGLEAMIEQKEVLVYGEALYGAFDQQRLKTYILHYLLPADYFGNDAVPPETAEAILARDQWRVPGGRK